MRILKNTVSGVSRYYNRIMNIKYSAIFYHNCKNVHKISHTEITILENLFEEINKTYKKQFWNYTQHSLMYNNQNLEENFWKLFIK